MNIESLEESAGWPLADDPEVVTEADVATDTPGPWVECEEYSRGCTGGNYASEMERLREGGWMCPTCYAAEQGDAEDSYRTARGW